MPLRQSLRGLLVRSPGESSTAMDQSSIVLCSPCMNVQQTCCHPKDNPTLTTQRMTTQTRFQLRERFSRTSIAEEPGATVNRYPDPVRESFAHPPFAISFSAFSKS